jgi:hypothetical protein
MPGHFSRAIDCLNEEGGPSQTTFLLQDFTLTLAAPAIT